MSGNSNRPAATLPVDQLLKRMSLAYQRRQQLSDYSAQSSQQFSDAVMRAIRPNVIVDSPFSRIALRFAALSSACAMIIVVLNLSALNVFDEARFTAAVGLYGFIL